LQIEWSEQARSDLIEIFQFIAADNPKAARKLLNKLQRSATTIGEQPLIGRVVSEFEVANIRERIVRPYRIIYRVLKDDILVLTVIPSRRILDVGGFASSDSSKE
jgi:addiction module RelE/StbE family toxin